MFAKGFPKILKHKLAIKFPLAVCDPCKQTVQITDVMDDNGYAKICQTMIAAGKVIPDQDTAELEWEPIKGMN